LKGQFSGRLAASKEARDVGRNGFSEEQIGVALRQSDAGTAVPEICRKLGIAEATFYRWKRKYALEVPRIGHCFCTRG
jgi:putative transposase